MRLIPLDARPQDFVAGALPPVFGGEDFHLLRTVVAGGLDQFVDINLGFVHALVACSAPPAEGAQLMYRKINFVLQAFLILTLSAAVSGGAKSQGSVTYQINPAHTGAVEFLRGFELPLRKVWSRDLPRHISYPVVAGKKAFVTIGDNHQASYGTELFALDLTTGTTLWSKPIPGTYFWSGTAYDIGRLFVINYDGVLRALDPATGSELWAVQLSVSRFSAPPTARDGIVYVSGSDGGGGAVYAVNGLTGDVLWTRFVEIGTSSSPALSVDGVFVSDPCGVHHFDGATGELRWRVRGSCNGGSSLTSVHYFDRVYGREIGVGDTDIGATRHLRRYEASSGKQLGTVIDKVVAAPAFRGGLGYFPRADRLDTEFVADNTLQWRLAMKGGAAMAPVVINGKVLVVSSTGVLSVLDGQSGVRLQRIVLGTNIPPRMEGSAAQTLSGLGVGSGFVLVPAGTRLFAFRAGAATP